MTKCIFYCVAGLGMFASPGCFAGHDVVVPHRVVHTTHLPEVVHRHYYPRRRYKQRVTYHNNYHRPVVRPTRRYRRHRTVYRRNVVNRTIINRHYYNSNGKRRKGKNKNKKW